MSRPNLSIERIALTLTALGTSAVLAACAKAEPAVSVQSDKAPMQSASAAAEAPPPPVVATPTVVANEPVQPVQPVDGLRKSDPTAASAAPARPKMNMHTPGNGGTGQASCGAGTCTADPKKK